MNSNTERRLHTALRGHYLKMNILMNALFIRFKSPWRHSQTSVQYRQRLCLLTSFAFLYNVIDMA